ncbi:hypothetical protein ACOMHN_060216 [Nucella lapillus]
MDVFVFIGWLLAGVATCVLVLLWTISSKRASSRQSLADAARHYLSVQALYLMGKFFHTKLTQSTRNVAQTQTAFLLKTLKNHESTEYGVSRSFESIDTVEDFKRRNPLTRYEDYAPYVQRMMEGERSVLTVTQPVVFGVSSGTSGSSKIIPMLKEQQNLFFMHAVSVFYYCLIGAFPKVSQQLRKTLKIFYNPSWRKSAAGIKVGPNSSTPSSQKSILHMYSTPAVAFDILSEPDALYVHLLFALKDRHLGMIEGNFASLVYNAMVMLQKSLTRLLQDIREGSLNPDLKIPNDIRNKLENLLQPDPARAAEIQRAFDDGVVGVCQRIWPELGVVLTVDSGSFTPYAEKLRLTFLKGVPLYSAVYAATEGLVGLNLWPGQQPSRYLPHPAVQFLEFIPVESCHLDDPDTLLLHQVKEGEEYEIVLTNVSGLYRYRLGDVVKVTEFYNQNPILEFLYRTGQFLNVRGEKTSESLFFQTLKETVAQWSGLTLVDYCCAESVLVDDIDGNAEAGNVAPRYHVFLEVDCEDGHSLPSEDQKQMIDTHLCEKSFVYSSFRQKGSIDVMKVHLLRHGTFQDFRHYVISTTHASSNQFKVPRVVNNTSFVQFLMERKL